MPLTARESMQIGKSRKCVVQRVSDGLTCCCQDKNQHMMLVHLVAVVDHFLLGQRNFEDGYVGYEKRCGPTNLATA